MADIGPLTVAHLDQRPVALFHLLINSLLFESDLTGFLKVFIANLLLCSLKLCDIGVMTFLNILMGALKNGILLESGNGLFLLNTTESSLRIIDASAEVNATIDITVVLTTLSVPEVQSIGIGNGKQSEKGNKDLRREKKSTFSLFQL